MSRVTWFCASFSGVLDWIALILVWFERSLPSAQVSEESCPWPLKLMTSQWVERTWIRMGGFGRFRGEWVNWSKNNFGEIRISQRLDWKFPSLFHHSLLTILSTRSSRKWGALVFTIWHKKLAYTAHWHNGQLLRFFFFLWLFTHEQNIIRRKTQLDDIAHEQTIICRQ